MVVEILSHSTSKYDQNEKKDVYERSGVKEYWMVNPKNMVVEGYYLGKNLYRKPFVDKGKTSSRLLDHEFIF